MTPDQLEDFLDAERSKYAMSWAVSSATYEASGEYDWMASFLDGFTRVLEVGVGDGLSTLNLLKNGHQVVGVDANRVCLELAYARVCVGFTTDRIHREKRAPIDGKLHISYESISDPSNKPQSFLIEGDILNDDELHKWLKRSGQFDGVVCWLIGTNPVDMTRHSDPGSSGPDPQMYRLKIQNLLYNLGGVLLRKGGVLHFVDRATIPIDESREHYVGQIAEVHLEQASGTAMSVDVKTIELRPRPTVAGGVDLTGRGESNRNNHFYTSVLAINK